MRRRAVLQLAGLAPLLHLARASGLDLVDDAQAQTALRTPPDLEMALTAAPGEVSLLPGAPTGVWRFSGTVTRGSASALQALNGSYLGPRAAGSASASPVPQSTRRTVDRSLARP